MIFTELGLKGAFIIEPEKLEDDRGFFARIWDQKKNEELGLNPKLVQCSISFSKKRGTLRGMHYQGTPYEEVKLVRCTRGKMYDVIIDLRNNSKTFRKWTGVELSAENHKMMYVPEGFAHGFQTLEDNTEVFYQMSQVHMPTHERGVRWDDKTLQISWPVELKIISKKDASWGYLKNE